MSDVIRNRVAPNHPAEEPWTIKQVKAHGQTPLHRSLSRIRRSDLQVSITT
jgi:hypothetical protein